MGDETADRTTPSAAASEKVLSDEILKDAQRRADRIRKRAQREAKKTLDDAAKEAESAAEKILNAARRRADRVAQSLLATIEQEVRRDLLEAQEAELSRLFDAARERLRDRAAYDYPAVLARLATEAIAAMEADHVVIELSEADRPIATEGWLGGIRRAAGRQLAIDISESSAPIDGGLIVRSADGRLLYENSFAARLRRLWPDLRRELAAEVFGDTGKMPVPPTGKQS
jgi:vacuolar-type H+-ATPase subunit E/Vma4